MYSLNHISREDVLKVVSQEEIYNYYFLKYTGHELAIEQNIISPLRSDDNNPSFRLYYNEEGKLLFKDFGSQDSGDVFDFVSRLENIHPVKTPELIYKEMGLENGKANVPKVKIKSYRVKTKRKSLEYVRDKWNKHNLAYWKKFYIDRPILEKFEVVPAKIVLSHRIPIIESSRNFPVYALHVGERFKIYCPYAEKGKKFLSTTTVEDIFGYSQLPESGEILVITKSLKDVMVLYRIGINAIAFQSESVFPNENVLEELKKRFKNIVILYDNDKAGIEHAARLSKSSGFRACFIDSKKAKDSAELIEQIGIRDFEKEIRNLIN